MFKSFSNKSWSNFGDYLASNLEKVKRIKKEKTWITRLLNNVFVVNPK